MTLHIITDLIQGSEEWHAARRGMVTASVVGQLLSVSKPDGKAYDCPECSAEAGGPCRAKRGGQPIKTLHSDRVAVAAENAAAAPDVVEPATGKQVDDLLYLLLAERITDFTEPSFMSDDMWRGVMDEPRARDLYSETYQPVSEVGFMVRDDWGFKIGFSPDGMVGEHGLTDGGIEVKSRRQRKQLATILSDRVPSENMAQIQCGLLVSGRSWWDYVSYCGGMPMWTKRVLPDLAWQKAIVDAVAQFEKRAAAELARYNSLVEGLPMTERIIEPEMTL